MASIRQFIKGDRNVKAPQSEIDAYVQEIHSHDGTLYLYLYNYAEDGPKPGSSPTQSLHFDRDAAKAFKELLETTFGPL